MKLHNDRNEGIRSLMVTAQQYARRFPYLRLFDSDDVAQAAMLRLLERKEKHLPGKSWLYKAIRSTAFDAGRKQVREDRYMADVHYDGLEGSVCEKADESGIVRLHTGHMAVIDETDVYFVLYLIQMLNGLSDVHREILLLCADGYSYSEMAKITGVSIGTVRSRISYARRRAQELLSEMEM